MVTKQLDLGRGGNLNTPECALQRMNEKNLSIPGRNALSGPAF